MRLFRGPPMDKTGAADEDDITMTSSAKIVVAKFRPRASN
jgi:hypothetical protein